MSQTSDNSSQRSPSANLRLCIAPARGENLTGVLGRLARLCMLDCYRTTHLSRRAAISMKFVALLLVINFFFDMGAWGLLFNALFSGGAGVFDFGAHTPLALLAALLISATIFIYEQAFMTADLERPFSTAEIENTRYRLPMPRWLRVTQRVLTRVFAPIAMRVLVVIGAALITTQPVELLFFKGPIERRAHEESVRLEAITKIRDYQDAQKKYRLEGPKYGLIKEEAQAAQGERIKAEQDMGILERQRASANSARTRAAEQARNAGRKINSVPQENRDYWRRVYTAAKKREADQQRRVDELSAQITSTEAVVKGKKEVEQNVEKEKDNQQKEAEAEDKLLSNWIARVRKADPGSEISQDGLGGQKWEFKDQSYDFFQQLRVLSDLRMARPARWPEGTTYQDRALLVEYAQEETTPVVANNSAAEGDGSGVTPPLSNLAAIQADSKKAEDKEKRNAAIQAELKKAEDEEKRNAAIDENFYTWAYWTVFCIAFVIPLLLLAFKLLQPQDLREYYSSEMQRLHGNYEAILFAPPGEIPSPQVTPRVTWDDQFVAEGAATPHAAQNGRDGTGWVREPAFHDEGPIHHNPQDGDLEESGENINLPVRQEAGASPTGHGYSDD